MKTLIIIYVSLVSLALGQQTMPLNAGGKDPFQVVSAQRAKEYDSYSQSLTANDPAKDVVLVLDLGGITSDDFLAAKGENNYVMAGDRRCNPSISISGTVDGKVQLRLVFIVPKEILDMQLFFDGHLPVTFKAAEKIHDRLD